MAQAVNLIPDDYYQRRRLRGRLLLWGAVLAVVGSSLLGLYAWEKGRCAALERRLEVLRAQSARRQELSARLAGLRSLHDSLRAKRGAIRSALGEQDSTAILAGLEGCLGQGCWLTSVEIDGAGGRQRPAGEPRGGSRPGAAGAQAAFRMRGYAPTHAALARMLPRLGEVAALGEPRLTYAKTVAVGGRHAIEFEIEAELLCG